MNENEKHYFNFLKCNLNFINETKSKSSNFRSQMETEVNELKKKNHDFEQKIRELEQRLNESEAERIQMENDKNSLQKELDEERNCKIKGEIIAKVKRSLLICGEIRLKCINSSLDTTKSKYIISSDRSPKLGPKAYENGEPITSLNQTTVDFGCKPGTYCIRCLVFDSNGKMAELISNVVETSGNSIEFEYEGKPSHLVLSQGRYKLEVWGAQGGNSTGKHYNSAAPGKGGLGGYSIGLLNLTKTERLHVYVGGAGQTSNLSEGSVTDGSFPDGGGTKTGYGYNYLTVPGTGGGSTSIRVTTDTLYTRVIVAGGGGGASGCSHSTDDGGFGGGKSGGNCVYHGNLKDQGCGTQTGSSNGIGDGANGESGQFGKGATGKYKQKRDSGGGGGGGWYGGGSGGYGNGAYCSSGGGGSGWGFTESSFNEFQSGDSSNASNFLLNSAYYLSDASTVGGKSQFPKPNGSGNETGHQGNGFAKITPL